VGISTPSNQNLAISNRGWNTVILASRLPKVVGNRRRIKWPVEVAVGSYQLFFILRSVLRRLEHDMKVPALSVALGVVGSVAAFPQYLETRDTWTPQEWIAPGPGDCESWINVD
jgi:hypothetical protein